MPWRLRPSIKADSLARFALLEGALALTVKDVRARALQIIKAHKAQRCLIVFDYLQRAAHNSGYDQLRHNVSKLTGELRELSSRLKSPVLALASQNRAAGDYGTKNSKSGGGSASLDSLKESGDLEYSADVVLFLTKDQDRKANEPLRAVKLTVAKNRFGALGSVSLMFRADHGVLSEVECRYE